MSEIFEPIERINRDMMKALRTAADDGTVGGVTDNEARFLVDTYYAVQEQRKRLRNQVSGLERDAKAAGTEAEPHKYLDFFADQYELMEKNVQMTLAAYTTLHRLAWFFDQTYGIGPVLSAGLLAHIDIRKADTAGSIWRFAGLDPTMTWEKGQKRPWNADLKTLCWKIGDSFRKFSNRDECVYGHVYRRRKEYEWHRNIRGGNAEYAREALERKKYGKDTESFKWYSGMVDVKLAGKMLGAGKTPNSKDCAAAEVRDEWRACPPDQIDKRAARYAVKLFLSHLQHRWYEDEYGCAPPRPMIFDRPEHTHFIEPPQKRPE